MARLTRENEFGLLECIDDNSGEIIWRQLPSKAMQKRIEEGKPIRLKNIPDPRTTMGRPSTFSFSPYYASIIITKLIEGYTILAIGKMDYMPSASTIYYWSKRYKDFSRLIQQARELRKDIIFDKIIDLAASDISREKVQVLKLRLEALKWAYEKIK